MEKLVALQNLSLRHGPETFEIQMAPSRESSWKQAYLDRCRAALALERPLNIFFSGGLDSLIPSLCFLELGVHDVVHTTFALTLHGELVNRDEFEYAEVFLRQNALKSHVIEHKLEELLESVEILQIASTYGLPHFEWCWQAYMIRHNPMSNSHYNIGCAGDLNASRSHWHFNPLWTFHERVRQDCESVGCFLFPMSSNALVCSWLLSSERLAAARDHESNTVARDTIIYQLFPQVKPRQKVFVYKQHRSAELLVNEFNQRHFATPVNEHLFHIPLTEVQTARDHSLPFVYRTKTGYRL